MQEPRNERPIAELESLKAPERTEAARRRTRARIVAAAAPLLARRRRPARTWEVLAGWARPGLVAAGLALALLAGSLRLGGGGEPATEPVRLDDVLAGDGVSGSVPAMLVATSEPDADAVVEMALLDRAHAEDITVNERR
jgi:hypothetical protein